jgi:hypothetical protein
MKANNVFITCMFEDAVYRLSCIYFQVSNYETRPLLNAPGEIDIAASHQFIEMSALGDLVREFLHPQHTTHPRNRGSGNDVSCTLVSYS